MTRKVEDQARWMADKFASQDKKIASLQTRGELAHSSIEDGAIVEKDLDGNLVASVGKQHDGSHVAVPYTGPIPAAPVAASLKAVPGVVEVRWSGKFTGDAVSAMDFKHVSVHVSTTPAVDATPTTQVATIRGELGDVATVTAVEGMLYVVLVAWSTAGKASAPSPVAAVAVPGAVDEAWIQGKLDDIGERYNGVITDAGNLGTRLSTAESELTAAAGRIADAEQDLTDAFGQITAVDGKASNAATAAATAQGKADTAKTAADQAAADALAAAGLAGSKGEIIYQVSAPTGTRANPSNLWIRSSDDKPHTYDTGTSKWVARTDKAALDAATAAASAASAAAAAQSTANAAQTAAGTAGTNATAALTMAGSKSKVYYSTAVATGTGTAAGDLWRQRNASNEVIAEWQWSGSAWIKQTVSGSNVSNMDIGFLTAGAATMSQALIDKLVAGTASFQTADVKNLFATTGTMAEAVIAKLWTDVVMSRKITAQMIAVGSFDNLINEPDFTNGGASWAIGANRVIVPGQGRSGGPVLRVTGTTGNNSAYNEPQRRTIDSGTAWRISAWVRSSADAVAGAAWIFAATFTSAGASRFPLVQSPALVAGQWTLISGVLKSSDTETTASFAVSTRGNFPTGATLDFDFVSVTRMNAGELTVDGTVRAAALESQLVLATDIIAGNPLGTHAKMNANGIRVMASTDGSAPTEVVRLGTDTDDYIGVVDPTTGNLSAAINSTGNISGQTGDFASDVTLAGTSLLEMLNGIPRGVVAWASRGTDAKYFAGYNVLPYLHLKFDVVPGRAYMVSTTPLTHMSDTANTDALVYLHYRTDGGTATVADTIISRVQTNAGPSSVGNRGTGTINRLITPTTPVVSLLLSYTCRTNVGRCKLVAGAANSVVLTVTDVGLAVPETGEYRDGTSDAAAGGTGGGEVTPPTPVKTYEQTFNTTGTRSFVGSGGTYAYNTGYMYSGLSPSGYGDLSSMAVFPSFTSMLSGATIHDIWAYVYYDFWYQGSGGTALISLHGQSALTSTKPSISGAVTVPGWPRAAGKWVRLPDSVYAGFKSGAWKGIALGGGGGGYERYGYAHDLKLKFKYTK